MPYYYVHIVYLSKLTNRLDICGCYDMNEESVRKLVAEPYMNGEELWLIGRRIDPYYIETINIYETEQSIKEMARGASSYYINLVVESILDHKVGQYVTHKFIRSPPPGQKTTARKLEKAKVLSKNIFIVHGRDHKPMEELKTMLYEFGLKPIVLHEKASGGLTLAEKLEKYSKDVGYAFVILTPDDLALPDTLPILPPLPPQQHFKQRARQNVIFEMGYFWGLLERKRVCCLLKGDVEKPSDIEGIVYIPFKNSIREVQVKIIKELTEADYEIKM